MTIQLLNYKEQVKEVVVGYKDNKNLIMNKPAVVEYNIIKKFEKERGISVDKLKDDSEFFDYQAKEILRMQEPFLKKIDTFFKNRRN